MKRSKFSLSHYKLLTCKMGQLIPCGLVEVLPGDSVQQATSALIRCSPMLAPVMHPVHVRIHHWFVPHRLVWDDWEDFITGGPDGIDASVLPYYSDLDVAIGSLHDHYGVAPHDYDLNNVTISALPARGYALIWNEWYRDQDLQDELAISTASGVDATTPASIQNVDWEKDYFTTARPWPQKGPAVTLPFATTAPVVSSGVEPRFRNMAGTKAGTTVYGLVGSEGAMQLAGYGVPGADEPIRFDGSQTGLVTDLSQAASVTVNQLREALALQRYAEARARYGSRYTEYLRYLGVRSSDARLQRPEYLGGGKQTIQFSEVLQTGPGGPEADEGVADLYGHGIGALRSRRYRRFFEEHGYIHSFISVKPKTMYANSIPRTWTRRTKEDFFQRELQHIGQQEVLNQEVYGGHATPLGVFGY